MSCLMYKVDHTEYFPFVGIDFEFYDGDILLVRINNIIYKFKNRS